MAGVYGTSEPMASAGKFWIQFNRKPVSLYSDSIHMHSIYTYNFNMWSNQVECLIMIVCCKILRIISHVFASFLLANVSVFLSFIHDKILYT